LKPRNSNQSKERSLPTKQVYLASTLERVVPLTHYMWLSVNEGAYKKSARTPYEQKIENMRSTPIQIASSSGSFSDENYHKMNDVLDYMYKNKTFIKRQFVIGKSIAVFKK
jgi:hypothetical protein